MSPVPRPEPPEAGSILALPLSDRPGDAAALRVLADHGRDLAPHARADRLWPLAAMRGGVLVEVLVEDRPVLPGAWAQAEDLTRLAMVGHRPITARDLRMPAVVLGEGPEAVLAWGETIWPLPFDGAVAIPAAARPGVHSAALLRRLALVASGRREEVGLTLWHDDGFEVPWHDVRLLPRARWWFEMAQVPATMRYADAARSQGVEIERLLAGLGNRPGVSERIPAESVPIPRSIP